ARLIAGLGKGAGPAKTRPQRRSRESRAKCLKNLSAPHDCPISRLRPMVRLSLNRIPHPRNEKAKQPKSQRRWRNLTSATCFSSLAMLATYQRARAMLINVHQAKSQLSKLIAAAEAGDDVVIARNGKPAVKLVPLNAAKFRLGALAHLVDSVPDFDDAMGEDELAMWERNT
ncbi:MAG: type II toxin-antitoxin system prevent-host-death family antitoxin, partial [Gammaproteobacteria bacterium]|nr:type II toxin-antitoxin system prevent-host-death family antitoxin [Gammaproteobacteria bacterium]